MAVGGRAGELRQQALKKGLSRCAIVPSNFLRYFLFISIFKEMLLIVDSHPAAVSVIHTDRRSTTTVVLRWAGRPVHGLPCTARPAHRNTTVVVLRRSVWMTHYGVQVLSKRFGAKIFRRDFLREAASIAAEQEATQRIPSKYNPIAKNFDYNLLPNPC